jgi:uncharacterized protein (DUF58 family)
LGVKAIVFYAVLLATFFAIPYANLYFLGMAFLSVVAAGNVLWAAANLRGVRVRVGEIAPTPAGQPIAVRFHVSVPHRRVAFLVAGEIAAGGVRGTSRSADIAGETVLHAELPPLPRGVYALGAGVRSTYPHGLLLARRPAPAPRELVVIPAPLGLPRDRHARRAVLATMGHDVAAADHGSSALRDWQTGDDVRRVHWKATARRGQLVVREPDDDDAGGSEVVLDRRCGADALEHALATVAALALLAEQGKERLVLHTQGTVATYGQGGAAWLELWRLLATAQPLPATAPPPPPAARSALRLPARLERAR